MNESMAAQLHYYDATKARWYWILRAVIAIATIIGNGLVVYIIAAKHKLRQKNANRFILSLCTADLCTGLFITPAECACAFRKSHPCAREMQLAMYEFFVYASALCLCALTFDRYMAVNSPLRYQTKITSKRVYILIALSWFLPLLSSLLHFSYLFAASELHRRAMSVFAVLESILFVALPCFLLPLVYARILIIIRRHSRYEKRQRVQIDFNYSTAAMSDTGDMSRDLQLTASNVDGPHDEGGEMEEQHMDEGKDQEPEIQVALSVKATHSQDQCVILIGVVIALFVTCWVFATYLHLRQSFSVDVTHVTGEIMNMSWLLILLNSALNPPVYAYMKKDIRRELRAFLGRRSARVPRFNGDGNE